MSFVTTQPEALTAAAGNLAVIGTALTAQNTAAAAPTTGLLPAAADEVSALQATLFSAYGTLYQQISAQATAIHEMLVNTLGANANAYATTEATNSAATGLLGMLTGNGSYGLLSSAAGNGAVLGAMQVSNFGSAASDLLQLGSSGFLAPGALTGAETPAAGDVSGTVLTGATMPTGLAGVGTAPVSAGVGQASAIGRLSVPPTWTATTVSTAAPTTLTGTGWTTAAPQGAAVTTLPAGMPSVASAGRGGFGFGTPRYGVKPTVMPRPAVV